MALLKKIRDKVKAKYASSISKLSTIKNKVQKNINSVFTAKAKVKNASNTVNQSAKNINLLKTLRLQAKNPSEKKAIDEKIATEKKKTSAFAKIRDKMNKKIRSAEQKVNKQKKDYSKLKNGVNKKMVTDAKSEQQKITGYDNQIKELERQNNEAIKQISTRQKQLKGLKKKRTTEDKAKIKSEIDDLKKVMQNNVDQKTALINQKIEKIFG